MSAVNKIIPAIESLYSKDRVRCQIDRYKKLEEVFIRKFGDNSFSFFSTPGRVELSGNHTDHNNGKVLAASIDLDSIAIASLSNTNSITIFSEGYENPFVINLDNLNKDPNEVGTTNSLIRGIAARAAHLGFVIGGFNACISSEVLPGSGLSSSASIEVLIGSMINSLFNNQKITPKIIAEIGQYAENEFFGKPCGLMDQMACAVGGIISIDFKNPDNALINKIDHNFSDQNYNLVLVDTGGNHADLTEDYASIPIEMKSVAEFFKKDTLNEITFDEYLNKLPDLKKVVGDRAVLRAFHFFEENERVDKQISALLGKDFNTFLQLVKESGDSSVKWLQNVYSDKNPGAQGITLALALSEKFISNISDGACRVHGGGFAGTIISFIPAKRTNEYKIFMENVFGENLVRILSIRKIGTTCLN